MIAVDTSALIAITLSEPSAPACLQALRAESEIVISAGTFAEAMVVALGRDVLAEVLDLLNNFAIDVIPLTPAAARRVGEAYQRWGRGFHLAGLNFGDCFAYEVARQHACPLLYVGDDFDRTDVVSAL